MVVDGHKVGLIDVMGVLEVLLEGVVCRLFTEKL